MTAAETLKYFGSGGIGLVIVFAFIRGWVVARNIHLERLRDKDEIITLYRNAQETTMAAVKAALDKQTELLNELVRRAR
jgi:hypothetical protein